MSKSMNKLEKELDSANLSFIAKNKTEKGINLLYSNGARIEIGKVFAIVKGYKEFGCSLLKEYLAIEELPKYGFEMDNFSESDREKIIYKREMIQIKFKGEN